MKSNDATSRPWWVDENKTTPNWEYKIKSQEGRHIATLNKYLLGKKSNAELIIRAVNSHEALVESLKDLLIHFKAEAESHGCMEARNRRRFQEAEQALALAEGK